MRMLAKGKLFMDVEAEGSEAPVFSESFLYSRIGKDDARFVLGVAEEYEHLIKLLGEGAVRELLTWPTGRQIPARVDQILAIVNGGH